VIGAILGGCVEGRTTGRGTERGAWLAALVICDGRGGCADRGAGMERGADGRGTERLGESLTIVPFTKHLVAPI
jgi:hypothetical protein